jgi:hypothetical protein
MTQINQGHQASVPGIYGLSLPMGSGLWPKMILVHW